MILKEMLIFLSLSNLVLQYVVISGPQAIYSVYSFFPGIQCWWHHNVISFVYELYEQK